MPEYLDRYLAEHVVSGQQTEDPVSPDRIDNLQSPAPAEMHSTHGRFDDEARPHVRMFDPTDVRRVVIGAGLALAAVMGAGLALAARGRRADRPTAISAEGRPLTGRPGGRPSTPVGEPSQS